MESNTQLQGLSTASFYADDLEKAKEWYSELLDIMYNQHYLEILSAK